MPNPGDSGSSLGACLDVNNRPVQWMGPYIGTEIAGDYPSERIVDEILEHSIVGVASGRAEFGPRAFGNRSLFADPRGTDIKDRVNQIKKRQEFRPFAPVILEEFANDYFDMGSIESSPYMQYTFECRHPDKFPAIVHADNTSRVQTVNKTDHPGLFHALTLMHDRTGCPMLLNTSLNIKGQPMVNTRADADDFENMYGVKVIS
jgi:carbamoyltransferase